MSVTSFSKFFGSLIFFFPLPQYAVVTCFLVAAAVVVRKKIKTMNVPLFICALNNHNNIYDKSFCLRSLCRLFLINHSLQGWHISLLGSLKKKKSSTRLLSQSARGIVESIPEDTNQHWAWAFFSLEECVAWWSDPLLVNTLQCLVNLVVLHDARAIVLLCGRYIRTISVFVFPSFLCRFFNVHNTVCTSVAVLHRVSSLLRTVVGPNFVYTVPPGLTWPFVLAS